MDTTSVFCVLCNESIYNNIFVVCNNRKHMIISNNVFRFLRILAEKVEIRQKHLADEIWSEEFINTVIEENDHQSEIYDYDSDGRSFLDNYNIYL